MKSRVLLSLLPLIGATSGAFAAPRKVAPKASSRKLMVSNFVYNDDPLEKRWSYRVPLNNTSTGGATWLFGRDERNGLLLKLQSSSGGGFKGLLSRVEAGKPTELGTFSAPSLKGELGLIRAGTRLDVLWNGERSLSVQTPLVGERFGVRRIGGWKVEEGQMQPTEQVVFRDDFMRASGPDSPEVPDEWKVQGVWKTSGTLGPRADASLSPNPFVFRASGVGDHVARAGKWWWSDYSVSASVRAMAAEDDNSPLVAAIEGFSIGKNSVRGEVDFGTGIARILIGGRIVAASAPFDASIGEWHRMRLEPANGKVRFLFDGHEVVSAACNLAQGEVALRAKTGAKNFVDFDDVRVGTQQDQEWGEGDLPDRIKKDRLMRNWANEASAWKRDTHGVWWHTGEFWGNISLNLPVPDLAKEGDGFRFYAGANPQNPPAAALAASVTRKEGKALIRLNGQTTTVPLAKGAKNSLRLILRATPKGNENVLVWNGKPLFTVAAGARNGTKLGIEPTHNGLPLPVPPLEKLSLRATTFEREGHSVIGVNITPVSPQIARDMGLPDATGAVIDNVENDSPAQRAGFQNGDVVRAANGARVLDVDTMRSAVGSVRAPGTVNVEILRSKSDGSGLDWSECRATTPNQLDYAFTSAPVDWKSARGNWEVAERWTCSPQWSFFAGQNDEFPLLWSRFALRGDWTLEAYVATPMDLTRSERSPMDLNISVGDGKNISSGYSFAFAAQNREKNVIWRGNSMVVQKPFEMPAGSGETHQDWFYVRLERRQTLKGVHFKWSVNGKTIGEYDDNNPIKTANRLAFWTKNGAISLARVRLWHDGLMPMVPDPRPAKIQQVAIPNGVDGFTVRGTGRAASAQLSTIKDAGGSILEVSNPHDGGDWAVYASRRPIEVSATNNRVLSFAYRATPDVKVNLYALVQNQWREIAWTGGASKPEDNQPMLGTFNSVTPDDKWHTARFDLNAALQRNGLDGNKVEAIAFSAPSRDYLRQGLGGNAQGAKYWVRDFKVSN
ncbi:PDZ domain-containing protein [bacterium]|nr:MAG: PDZ domain-containing protein [bacterium]